MFSLDHARFFSRLRRVQKGIWCKAHSRGYGDTSVSGRDLEV